MPHSGHHLTRLSAFWALVPIALNTMSLPSGKVLSFPSSWNFALRSSPIICVASTLDGVCRLIYYTWTEKSPSRGLDRWITNRFEDTEESGDGSFDSLRSNKYFVAILFVLGTLPQVVKIFAVRGAPFTQAYCAAYLSSFLFDGLITLASRRRTSKNQECGDSESQRGGESTSGTAGESTANTWYEFCSLMVLGISIIVVNQNLAYSFHTGKNSDPDSWIVYAYPFAYTAFATILGYPLGKTSGSLKRQFRYVSFLVGASVRLPEFPAFYANGWRGHFSWRAIIMWFQQLSSVGVMMEGLKEIRVNDAKGHANMIFRINGTFLAFLHLYTAWLFYRYAYDPMSTFKPRWTNVLG